MIQPHVTKSHTQQTLWAHLRVGQLVASCITFALQAFVSWSIARAVFRGTYTEETLWFW